ncbi:MAG: hypothetical protein J3Q66DRAFT_406559 [Benniella sp.]|nr:MAG: hypothetical protein J3Q66DRAFT_406559 [Benniella sp.]
MEGALERKKPGHRCDGLIQIQGHEPQIIGVSEAGKIHNTGSKFLMDSHKVVRELRDMLRNRLGDLLVQTRARDLILVGYVQQSDINGGRAGAQETGYRCDELIQVQGHKPQNIGVLEAGKIHDNTGTKFLMDTHKVVRELHDMLRSRLGDLLVQTRPGSHSCWLCCIRPGEIIFKMISGEMAMFQSELCSVVEDQRCAKSPDERQISGMMNLTYQPLHESTSVIMQDPAL